MNRIGIVVLGAMFAASFCYGPRCSCCPRRRYLRAVGHGVLSSKVDKTLDSSKLKEGDAVEVEMASGIKLPDGTVVPKGSKVMGHVVAAKARSKGDPESELTVTFDKLNVANGKQLSVKGMVQAVFPAPDEQMDPSITGAATTAAGGSAGGVGPSGVGGGGGAMTSVGVVTDSKSGSNTNSDSRRSQPKPENRSACMGSDNLQLDNGVLTSKGKNVKLGSGVRMVVHVDIFG